MSEHKAYRVANYMEKDETQFRLIIENPADGQWNMAVDEALLEAVSAGQCPPVIRLYGFDPPTLSVGRFQTTPGTVQFDRIRSDGIAFVRRPSGGQSVLHSNEITYAFVIGRDHLSPFGKRWVYRFVTPLLMAGLRLLGLHEVTESRAQKGNPTNPDCFGSTSEYEIDSPTGRKLVGSAQMVTRTAVLQHGSIPLGAESRAITRYLAIDGAGDTHATNVAAEIGRTIDFATAQHAFVEAISGQLPVTVDGITGDERRRATELLTEKYSRDEWNKKY